MQWMAPMTAVIAAGIVVPPLVLLYFLKLKRREELISCTLLWKRAVQDLQVNAPFQRLRRNILLLLQLLALVLILAALGRPVLSLTAGAARRYVLLIDRSASMNAVEGGTPRLEAAKTQAKVLVESLRSKAAFSLREASDQAMVIAFDSHAKVMCNFTSDKRQLSAAIDSIQPTDCGSSLSEAVTVARAFAQLPAEDADVRTAQPAARLELFSDGRIHDLEGILLGPEELTFHCVGAASENLAVTAMQARRSYEKPEEVEVFATLANYGDKQVTADVQLSLDGDVRSVRSLTIPPLRPGKGGKGDQPGTTSISFALSHSDAAVLEVRQPRRDPLASDDAAWAILPRPRKLKLLLVTNGNPTMRSALASCPLAGLDVESPAEFDARDLPAMSVEQPYDVIVLDNCAPAKLPEGRFLVFGRPPAETGVSATEQLHNQVYVDWRSRHPVLQYVSLTNFFALECWKMSLPKHAEVLAEFGDGPAMALLRKHRSVFLLAGFDVLETNWPFEPSFVMFCYNAVNFLGLEVGRKEQTCLRVGQPINMASLPPGASVRLSGPGLPDKELAVDEAGTLRYPGTYRVGVYTVAAADRPAAQFAVSLLDAQESRIAPAREIVLSGRQVEAQAGPPRQANVELWPFLAGLALVLVCVEWFVYNAKARV